MIIISAVELTGNDFITHNSYGRFINHISIVIENSEIIKIWFHHVDFVIFHSMFVAAYSRQLQMSSGLYLEK